VSMPQGPARQDHRLRELHRDKDEAGAKEAGKVRSKGKTHEVEGGEAPHYIFSGRGVIHDRTGSDPQDCDGSGMRRQGFGVGVNPDLRGVREGLPTVHSADGWVPRLRHRLRGRSQWGRGVSHGGTFFGVREIKGLRGRIKEVERFGGRVPQGQLDAPLVVSDFGLP
jgi:hypothetical protein